MGEPTTAHGADAAVGVFFAHNGECTSGATLTEDITILVLPCLRFTDSILDDLATGMVGYREDRIEWMVLHGYRAFGNRVR